MSYNTIILKKDRRIATLLLNRPEKLNALNVAMLTELVKACDEISNDSKINAVIVTGVGKGFCSGADLTSPDFHFEKASDCLKLMRKITQVVIGIKNIPQPVISAVNGVAIGGGCNLALACDIILASDKAIFTEPYVKRAIHPDLGATYFLPRFIGLAKASDLLLTGKAVDAYEADRIGLISRVIPAEQLLKEANKIAKALGNGPQIAIRMIKKSLHQSLTMDLSTVLGLEAKAQCILSLTEDSKEAIASFIEKRSPRFRGK